MRIKQINVKNLFGMFNHTIPMKMNDRITIIHGPNGLGKTFILKMLDSLFNLSFYELRRIPFGELSVNFDKDLSLIVKKDINDETTKRELIFELIKNDKKVESYNLKSNIRREFPFPLGIIETEISELQRLGVDTWLYLPTQEELSLEEVLDRFNDRLPHSMTDIPDWLKEIINLINVHFIETQRLLSFLSSHSQRDFKGKVPTPAVNKYSQEIINKIQSKLAEYATLSHSLDRTFPIRLVKGIKSKKTIEQLKNSLNDLEKKRSLLVNAGLLDQEEDIDFKELQNIDESNKNVLLVYVEDMKKKLSVFDEMTDKIEMFVNIINKTFLYKHMSISKKDGFVFKTSENKIISPTSLSSGEQHELVLLYELLFKVKPNSLILIDEPELSLHVAWQQQFLKDLRGIIKLTDIDILIATHSPQIIHDRWDLTVELNRTEK